MQVLIRENFIKHRTQYPASAVIWLPDGAPLSFVFLELWLELRSLGQKQQQQIPRWSLLYMNRERPDVQAGLEKAEEPETKLSTSAGSSKKQESSRKTSISALLTMPKPLTVWITTNCEKFWKRWEYQTTWPVSWEISMQVKKQQLELDMDQ